MSLFLFSHVPTILGFHLATLYNSLINGTNNCLFIRSSGHYIIWFFYCLSSQSFSVSFMGLACQVCNLQVLASLRAHSSDDFSNLSLFPLQITSNNIFICPSFYFQPDLPPEHTHIYKFCIIALTNYHKQV